MCDTSLPENGGVVVEKAHPIDTNCSSLAETCSDNEMAADGRVLLVKLKRKTVAKDGRMVASFAGKMPNDDDDENSNSSHGEPANVHKFQQLLLQQKQLQQQQPSQRQRRQILASIGQPPRPARVGWGRRASESRSLDRRDGRNNFSRVAMSDNDECEQSGSPASNGNGTLAHGVDASGQYRDDKSKREFIEKLQHFERLTIKPDGKIEGSPSTSSVVANNKNCCQSVPLSRRPPPPPPAAPPKPPYQPHPDIENRLRFFDAAFGRHHNLRDRRLENLVAPSTTSSSPTNQSVMSASLTSATMSHDQQLSSHLFSQSSTDDSSVIYNSTAPNNTLDLISNSSAQESSSFSPKISSGGRIEVLNRISNQLLLSTAPPTAVTPSPEVPQVPAPAATSTKRTTNSSLQATEAELRRELEHLDLMLNNIKDTNKTSTSSESHSNNMVSQNSPLAALTRDRRHSVATGAMSAANGNHRPVRVQTVTTKVTPVGINLIPVGLRAEIQNYRRPSANANDTTGLKNKEQSTNAQQNIADQTLESSDNTKKANGNAQIVAKITDRSSPLSNNKTEPRTSQSPSPTMSVGGKNGRRVVFVRGKIPVSGNTGQSAEGDDAQQKLSNNLPQPMGQTVIKNESKSDNCVTTVVQTSETALPDIKAVTTDVNMLSPSSSASSSNATTELSEDSSREKSVTSGVASESGMPPPPTPSPPSRDNFSSDSSTPPPPAPSSKKLGLEKPVNDDAAKIIQYTDNKAVKTAAVSPENLLNNGSGVRNTTIVVTAVVSSSMSTTAPLTTESTQSGANVNQPSPSLTPSITNSDSSGALSANAVTPSSSAKENAPSPVIIAHKQQQQILRDISTLRHCLIDIETQQQHILQEVSALRAEATAVNEVESIRETIRTAELGFELERERANARLIAARNKVHSAARELQHLEQQRLMTTPVDGEAATEDEADETSLIESRQQLANLQEDVADADFELVEAETRYEAERERLMARLSAATEAATSASLLAKNGQSHGLVGNNDYWIRRMTEHFRQLDSKRQLIERNLEKLQSKLPFPNGNGNTATVTLLSETSSGNGTLKTSHSGETSSTGTASSHSAKEQSLSADAGSDPEKHSIGKPESDSSTGNNVDTQSCSDSGPTEQSNRTFSAGDEQQQPQPVAKSSMSTDTSESLLSSSIDVQIRHGGMSRKLLSTERPRTLFLPQPDNASLDLREHLDALSHDWRSCNHIQLSSDGLACRGWLQKYTRRMPTIVRPWSKRWFVFSRQQRELLYFTDSSETNPRDRIEFSAILDVYVETAPLSSGSAAASSSRLPRPPNSSSNLLIVIQTVDRKLMLAAPSPQAARIWIDVLFTGAAGNQSYDAITSPQEAGCSAKLMPFACTSSSVPVQP